MRRRGHRIFRFVQQGQGVGHSFVRLSGGVPVGGPDRKGGLQGCQPPKSLGDQQTYGLGRAGDRPRGTDPDDHSSRIFRRRRGEDRFAGAGRFAQGRFVGFGDAFRRGGQLRGSERQACQQLHRQQTRDQLSDQFHVPGRPYGGASGVGGCRVAEQVGADSVRGTPGGRHGIVLRGGRQRR